jgi:hypothetical protein
MSRGESEKTDNTGADLSDNVTNAPAGEPAKTRRQRRSANWGGARPGSGRHPNEMPTLWMQVAVAMTEAEAAVVTALSPGQRANRLLNPAPSLPELHSVPDSLASGLVPEEPAASDVRRAYNFRVALSSLDERRRILQLGVAERTLRLLTLPAGGVDPPDERKGKWYGKERQGASRRGKDPTR